MSSDSVIDDNGNLIPEKLRELFELEDGCHLIWRHTAKATRAGDEAGWLDKHNKGVFLLLNKKRIRRDRIIYTIHYGEDPGPQALEKLDGNPLNDRPLNLILKPVRRLPDSLD